MTADKTTADSAAGGALTLTAGIGDGSSGAVGGAIGGVYGGVGARAARGCDDFHDDRDRQLGLFRWRDG